MNAARRLSALAAAAAALLLAGPPDARADAVVAGDEVPRIGATVVGSAAGRQATFRVWAPNAHSAVLKGDFTGWKPLQMQPDPKHPGYWTATSPRARDGDAYQYLFDGRLLRRDPAARRVSPGENKAIVVEPQKFDWAARMAAAAPATRSAGPVRPGAAASAWKTPPLREMVIYEMHLDTFVRDIPGGKSAFLRASKAMPYLKGLGINAIQLMPVCEFPGERSWGYNPGDLFAIESSLGTPDDFREFVAAAHANGIAVLLDVVHNHYGPDQVAAWQFDVDGGPGPYFYSDPSLAETEWGPRPDYSKAGVRDFILANIRMFLEEYRLDGFRWDSVYNIRYTPGNAGEANADGDRLLREVNAWMAARFPRAIRIAEDHAYDNGGVGFDAQWHSAFQATLSDFLAMPDARKDVASFAAVLARLEPGWIQFSECHDSAGDLNGHHRLPACIDPVNPASTRARALSLMANAVVMTVPGTPMYLQGFEGHDVRDFSDTAAFEWGSVRGPRRGLVQANAHLAALRRNLTGATPGLLGDEIAILQADPESKVLAYGRRQPDASGPAGASTLVVHNFSTNALKQHPVRLPVADASSSSAPRAWFCHFTSARPDYDPDFKAFGPAVGDGFQLPARQNAIPLDLAPWSTVILSPVPPARPNMKVVARCTLPDLPELADGPAAPGVEVPALYVPSVDHYVEQIVDPFPYFPLPLP